MAFLDIAEATFTPRSTDGLKPGASALIGVTGRWQNIDTQEEGDPFPGQDMWQPQFDYGGNFAWVLGSDLTFTS